MSRTGTAGIYLPVNLGAVGSMVSDDMSEYALRHGWPANVAKTNKQDTSSLLFPTGCWFRPCHCENCVCANIWWTAKCSWRGTEDLSSKYTWLWFILAPAPHKHPAAFAQEKWGQQWPQRRGSVKCNPIRWLYWWVRLLQKFRAGENLLRIPWKTCNKYSLPRQDMGNN